MGLAAASLSAAVSQAAAEESRMQCMHCAWSLRGCLKLGIHFRKFTLKLQLYLAHICRGLWSIVAATRNDALPSAVLTGHSIAHLAGVPTGAKLARPK